MSTVLGMDRPNPDGWQGGSEDFGFIRTLDGHVAPDRFATGDADKFGHRNATHSLADSDLGDA